jgi:MFS transporter, DHA1 family, inner membrane transport protein
VASGLGASRSAVGILLTLYAAVLVLAAAPLTAMTARVERRRLVVLLLAGMGACNLVAAVAPS